MSPITDQLRQSRVVSILILSANADVTTEEFLAQEAEATRAARTGKGDRETVIRVLRATDQTTVRTVLADFAPDVIHFTGHGGPSDYVVLEDRAGAQRRLTGQTLARLLRELKLTVRFMLLNNCRLYGPRPLLSLVDSAFVSFYSARNAVDISPLGIRAFYETVDFSREASDSIVQLGSVIERVRIEEGVVARFFRGESGRPAERVPFDSEVSETSALSGPHFDFGGLSQAERPTRIQPPDGANIFRVWYGTNRRRVADPLVSYCAERADFTSYGYCDVLIPKHHTIGSVGNPWWRKLPLFWREDRLSVKAVFSLSPPDYWRQLQELSGSLQEQDRVLLIFIHGYNASFSAAVLRAAQIGFDLAIPGITALFSWPSKGKVAGYPADEAAIEASEHALADFVVAMANDSGATRTHLIAHSMGNRALLRAFTSAASRASGQLNSPIQQIFLAAPDVDVDLFKSLAKVYKDLATRTTMYVSSKDKALWSSGLLHDYPRAGYAPPITVVAGVDTVEVSNVDLSFLGHGYIAQARTLLQDMHELMQSNTPPEKRFGLVRLLNDVSLPFWRIKA